MQIIAVSFYMLISALIYYFAGPHVSSPALGSASTLVRKISFGIALPTVIVAGVINGSVACKYIYIRLWKGSETRNGGVNVIHQNSWRSLGSWTGICAAVWVLSWVIAEAIPSFNLLLGLIAALFCSWFSCKCLPRLAPAMQSREAETDVGLDTLPGFLWIYMNKGRLLESRRKIALTVLNVGISSLGIAIVSHHTLEFYQGRG